MTSHWMRLAPADPIRFSVVVPVYNKARHVGRALNSIQGQSLQPIEVIVVDDGSTDGSAEVVRSVADPRIKMLAQPNAGVSASRNRGIREARGNVIAFLDADDEWMPQYLATVVDLMRAFPGAAAWSTAYRMVSAEGRMVEPDSRARIVEGDAGAALIDFFSTEGFDPFCVDTIAVRRDVLLEIGGFPEGIVQAEDTDTWIRLALRYPIAWTNRPCAIYHRDVDNAVFGSAVFVGVPPLFKSLQAFQADRPRPSPLPAGAVKLVMCFHLRALKYNLLAGRRHETLQVARDCMRIRGYRLRGLACALLSLLPHRLVLGARHLLLRLRGRHSDLPRFRALVREASSPSPGDGQVRA